MLAGIAYEPEGSIISQLGTYYDFLTNEQRDLLMPRLEGILEKRLQETSDNKNLLMSLFDFYAANVHSERGRKNLHDFLSGKKSLENLDLDQDRRWSIIRSLAAHAHAGILEQIAEEEKKDKSTKGKRLAYAAKVSIPDNVSKDEFWKSLEKIAEIPYGNLRLAASNFHHAHYSQLTLPYVDLFFQKIITMDWKKNDHLNKVFFNGLFPTRVCNRETLKKSMSEKKRAQNLSTLTLRLWKEAEEELEKCIFVKAKQTRS